MIDRIRAVFGRPAPTSPARTAAVFGSAALTHKDILSRCRQLSMVFPFNKNDIAFNALNTPFGIVYGTLMPVLSNMKIFLHPARCQLKIKAWRLFP